MTPVSDTQGWKGRRLDPPGAMGPMVGEIRKIWAAIRELRSRAPLQSASISDGGLTIKDGGDLTIQDGGNVLVQDGGNVEVSEGGSFRSMYDDGTPGAAFGPLWLDSDPDVTESIGLLVQAAEGDDNRDVFRAKTVLSSGSKEVYVGQADNSGNVDVFRVFADSAHVAGDNSASLTSAGSGQIVVEAGGTLFLKGAAVAAQIPNLTGSANLLISGGSPTAYGEIRRATSSLRYKQDIEPLDLSHLTADQIVDALQGVTWRDRGMVEADPDTTLRIPGHIAEWLVEAGLEAFVVYDDQGRPDAISYDRLSAALAQALRATRAEVAVLREQLGDVMTRLETLEGT